jgi:hypothetical protein
MTQVVGLFWQETNVDNSIRKLEKGGFPKDSIVVISTQQSIRELFDCCEPLRIAGKYAGWGAFFGVLTYAPFALVAGWCECTILAYGQEFALGTLIAGILAGTVIGGMIGLLIGWAEADKDVQFYLQGMRLGGRVLAVNAPETEIEKARDILDQENAHEVRIVTHSEIQDDR